MGGCLVCLAGALPGMDAEVERHRDVLECPQQGKANLQPIAFISTLPSEQHLLFLLILNYRSAHKAVSMKKCEESERPIRESAVYFLKLRAKVKRRAAFFKP